MQKQLFIVLSICLQGVNHLAAQAWTKEDSIGLQRILSGRELLKLNPETMDAIRTGTLINFDRPAGEMQPAPAGTLPILKDFTEYILPDTAFRRKVALKDLPPGVILLYGPPPLLQTTVYQNLLDAWRRSPFYYYTPHGSGGVGMVFFFDMGELTSRKAWVHKRNAKRDGTWKNYNNLPTSDIIEKKRRFAAQHPELAGQDTLLLRRVPTAATDTLSAATPH